MSKPVLAQTLKGFRDFLPEEKRKRDVVEEKMKGVFEKHGFAPFETPTLEYASLLLGKYGQEADKLVYTFADRGAREIGLRYDQTVPTARALVQYRHLLPKYFRRYQIQNVFRADKPQKGRYREFRQCDCDIFNSTSPIADAEILSVFYNAYQAIGLTSLIIEINDRQTLMNTLTPFATPEVSVLSIIQSIDKLDKETVSEVAKELEHKGLAKSQAEAAIQAIEKADMSENLKTIVHNAIQLGIPAQAIKFNPKIARGLDYYTGMIFEGRVPEYSVGSVGGGGRYDNLIEMLSGEPIPAVGFAVGFDRTVEAADQLGLLSNLGQSAQVMVAIFNESYLDNALHVANLLRESNISAEVYPELDALGKQFKVADQKGIPFVAIVGEAEATDNTVTLKNMKTGDQQRLPLTDLPSQLR